jgi:DNA repair exonuclease SbcCD nuclease subunit
VKLAHLADLHLGFRQFERQTPRGGNQREVDVAEAFRRAVDDLLDQRPDVIVIAGDVFHSVRPTNPAILFLFQQLQRLRVGLPDAPIVIIAGNHDTPRSAETGTILRLYETLGAHIVVDAARRVELPKLECAVYAVPHQAIVQAERPALRPERQFKYNILLLHGEIEGMLDVDRSVAEYGGAVVSRADLGAARWDYVALGHYHVTHEVEANVWYAGSLDYVSTNPWGELTDEHRHKLPGKGYLLVDLPGGKPVFRPIAPVRRFIDLPPVEGAGLTAQEIDAAITQRVEKSKPPIDDQVVRLVVNDVSRGTARDLDHTAVRAIKSRALNFQLDLRRPAPAEREVGVGGPGRRLTLPETVREYLRRRPLDADLERDEFVRLGVEYVERAAADAGAED